MNRTSTIGWLTFLLVCTMILISRCGSGDRDAINRSIEDALNADRQGGAPYPFVRFRTGVVMLNSNEIDYLKKAQAKGLVRLEEVPQDYWGSFLATTQGMGRPFRVTPDPKVVAAADNAPTTGDTKQSATGDLQLTVAKHRVDKIITEEKYAGPLASPGERHVLVLGTFERIPTPAARVVGVDMARQEIDHFRFRAVLRYSKFNKAWTVVAIDAGALTDDEVWFTSKVK